MLELLQGGTVSIATRKTAISQITSQFQRLALENFIDFPVGRRAELKMATLGTGSTLRHLGGFTFSNERIGVRSVDRQVFEVVRQQ